MDCLNATRLPNECIKNYKGYLITADYNKYPCIYLKRKTAKTWIWTLEEKHHYKHFKWQFEEIPKEMALTGLRKGNLKWDMEALLIATKNAIRTNPTNATE